MKFFVMGYVTHEGTEIETVVLMTRKPFPTLEAAQTYAAGCAKGFRPFIVQTVEETS